MDREIELKFLIPPEAAGEAYSAQVRKESLRGILRDYLAEQKTVSPDGNPWE